MRHRAAHRAPLELVFLLLLQHHLVGVVLALLVAHVLEGLVLLQHELLVLLLLLLVQILVVHLVFQLLFLAQVCQGGMRQLVHHRLLKLHYLRLFSLLAQSLELERLRRQPLLFV